jgi:hypothetical protein
MTSTYHLIENIPGFIYWVREESYGQTPLQKHQIAKYGTIYVNRKGGFLTKNAIKKILKTVDQRDFPEDP